MVLLGIHTSLKLDIECCAAEFVYGTTLELPGEYFYSSKDQHPDPVMYTSQLKAIMQQLRPPPVKGKHHKQPYMSNDLTTCTHIFVCHDAVKTAIRWTLPSAEEKQQTFYIETLSIVQNLRLIEEEKRSIDLIICAIK